MQRQLPKEMFSRLTARLFRKLSFCAFQVFSEPDIPAPQL
jgi:hypothetical protein